MNEQQIIDLIGVRPPYLWIDTVTELTDDRIVCTKELSADLEIFSVHYDGFPLFPGALQCEACFQASNVLLTRLLPENPGHLPVIARVRDVKFKKLVRPDSVLTVEVSLDDRESKAIFLSGVCKVDGAITTSLKFIATEAPVGEESATG